MNGQPFWLSLQVTGTATLGILIIGLVLALLLARVSFRGKLILETIIYLPLVLPPTVVGYYLLFILGRGSFLLEQLKIALLFTWQAAVFASIVVGLPLMVQTARAAFEEVDPEVEGAARVDGAGEWQVWWYVTLPLAQRGILAGVILSAARALGEFGATLMIAGNIPGRTQTLPLAIYDAVQARRYEDANVMVIVVTSLAFSGLWLVYRLGKGSQKRQKQHDSARNYSAS
ncbi:MAG TPA: molybdate ABC transporter permease subunit [Aggregatilineales bacterium]|nr:molybdate ABC transporter permease subunit [Anaerolineales bacterium]HRE46242.1 molybdate ABC transporter permease subunit [Aggregatilineales bacterium]